MKWNDLLLKLPGLGRFMFVGDPHIGNQTPESRVDDFGETVLRKLAWVIQVAVAMGLDAIILAGDTVERTIESLAFRIRVKELLLSSPIPIYTLIGNHPGDTIQNKIDSWTTRELGDLAVSGCVKPFSALELPDGNLALALNAYQYTEFTLPTDISDRVTMIFAHTFIDISDPLLSFSSPKLKRMYPNLKAIFAGHDHQHYSPIKIMPDCMIYRPGSLLRISNDQSSQRMPVVGVYDFGKSTYEEIEVAVALPPAQIFSSTVKMLDQEASRQLGLFVDSVSNLKAREHTVAEQVWAMAAEIPNAAERLLIEQDLVEAGFVKAGA